MTNTNIKEWYTKEYPTDELGNELKSDITFYNLFECLDGHRDVYQFLGVRDSLIRERVFSRLAEIMKRDYNYVYNQWLRA